MVAYEQMTLLFALLGIVAQFALVALAIDVVSGAGVRFSIAPWALWAAFLVALTSLSGSLYLSEVAHLNPCRLCWYQRAAIYPLVPLLGIAAWRRSLRLVPVIWTLNLVGSSISLWHVFIERYPTLDTGACDALNPCTIIWFRHFGYLTIPALALVTQITVAAFVGLARADAVSNLDQRSLESVL